MKTILFIILFLVPLPASAQIVISEVMWSGSPYSSADEWLEIVNTSSEKIALSRWQILKRSSDGSDTPMITFEEDESIEPGEYKIISNYSAEKSALNISPHVVSTSVSLSNTKLFLQLIDGSGALIDQVDDGTGSPFAGSKDPYASMERIDLLASGSEKSNWRSAEVSIGFDQDVVVFGTPGETNILERGDTSPQSSSATSEESSSECGQVCPRSVIISEVLANPSGSDDYEWIELANISEQPINIVGWKLSDNSRDYVIEARDEHGYTLDPKEYVIFYHYQTGLSLSNQGEQISLEKDEKIIDQFTYQHTGEEISFGREGEASVSPFCIPTPRQENQELLLDPKIVVQSGRSTDYTKVTLNLKAEVEKGSLKDAECFWDFDDGTSSETCNPPSRSWDTVGNHVVELRVKTRCGDEIVRELDVVVLQKNRARSAGIPARSLSPKYSQSSSSKYSIHSSIKHRSSISSSLIEQKMYSTISTTLSSRNPVELLPVRLKNVREHSSSSFSQMSSYPLAHLQVFPQPVAKKIGPQPSNAGLPWFMLFSQSTLWLVLAGKKMI